MDEQTLVKNFERTLNKVECSHCGRKHHVRMTLDERTEPHTLKADFSEDTCTEFIESTYRAMRTICERNCIMLIR